MRISSLSGLWWCPLPGLLLAAFLSLPASGQAPAPRYVYERWTVADGLPVNTLNDLLQAQNGYIWLATFDGLIRFDGVRFTVFNVANTPGLPSNRILRVLETRDGMLWIVTEQSQLVRFDGDSFKTLGTLPTSARWWAPRIFTGPDSTLWAGTATGLLRVDGDRLVPFAPERVNMPVLALAWDQAGAFWVGTAGAGLLRWNGRDWDALTSRHGLPSDTVWTLYDDPRDAGVLWIGAGQGISRYQSGRITTLAGALRPPGSYAHNEVLSFRRIPGGALWIQTQYGPIRYQDDRLTQFWAEDRIPNQLPEVSVVARPGGGVWRVQGRRVFDSDHRVVLEAESHIRALLLDQEGSLWITTHNSGLYRLRPSFFTIYGRPEGLADANVYGLHEDRSGAVWIGMLSAGVARLQNGVVTNFGSEASVPLTVWSIYEDRRGTLWLGSVTEGAPCRFVDGSCRPFPPPITHLQDVRAFHEDRRGNFWIGAQLGLWRCRGGDGDAFASAEQVSTSWVRGILEARDGTLWFATNGDGVLRLGAPPAGGAAANGDLTALTTAQGLSSDRVRALYEDPDGYLWVGTEDRGLNRVDLRTGGRDGTPAIRVIRQSDGLFDDVIHQILEDAQGRLWMSTNRGLFWVTRRDLNAFADGRTDHVRSIAYDERDGLRNREANGGAQGAGIRSRDGRLWFPTQDGVAVVDPAEISTSGVPPPVHIERVVAEGRAYPVLDGTVILPAEARDFEVEYTGLSFLSPEAMRFRFQLDGYDAAWREVSRRTAYYTQVRPGAYTFRVTASNREGIWSTSEAALRVVVQPYFYETAWFYGLIALLLVGLTAGGVRWRVRQLQRRASALEGLVAERTEALAREKETVAQQAGRLAELDRAKSRFFANISHEFRTPLTLIVGPLEDLQQGLHGPLHDGVRTYLDVALQNARRLLRLINQLLDVSKLEAGQLTLTCGETDVSALLSDLALPFAPLAERRRIHFDVEVPPEPVLAWLDPEQFEKVVFNLLSNAFKFTPEGGRIRLALTTPADMIQVEVRDTGAGIPAERLPHIFERFYQSGHAAWQAGTGIGLSLVKELVELHHGQITVESTYGFGTAFSVLLPRSLPDEAATAAGRNAAGAQPPHPARHPAALAVAEDGDGFAGPPAPPLLAPDDEAEEDRPTLLVVDDHPDVRAYIRRSLEARYRIVEAADGRTALEQARRILPDLIVSDVMMPDMDGFALCRTIKRHPDLDYLPVILLTARASVESRIEGLETGADDYLTKPFQARELEARVDNLIASPRRLRERFGRRLLPAPAPTDVVPADVAFLQQVQAAVEAHLEDPDFSVENLADAVGHSRSNLHRLLREHAELSPGEFIYATRLNRAAQLLAARAATVGEVAYRVGFKSVTHFSTRFRKQYGCPPSAYPPADHPAT